MIAEQLIDAAKHLLAVINQYKQDEIGARIAELKGDATIEPAIKALAIDRLNDLLARFQKETRESFPVIRVIGE